MEPHSRYTLCTEMSATPYGLKSCADRAKLPQSESEPRPEGCGLGLAQKNGPSGAECPFWLSLTRAGNRRGVRQPGWRVPAASGAYSAARLNFGFQVFWAVILILGVAFAFPANAQQARRLWDTQLIQQSKAQTGASPKAAKKASTKTASADPAPVYTTPDPATEPLTENDAIVGITVWNLRPAKAPGEVTLRDKAKKIEWTPERIEAQTPLDEGAQVRLSIEAPREGYLYVIDREQYADGSSGDPYLIFPTTRTAGGDNKVVAGRVIEVPAQEDNPPYFTLKRSRKHQTAELIQIIVSAQPLPGIKIGRNALKLSNEQVAEWNSKWGGKAERFELAEGAGKPWTKAEKEAGLRTRLLVQEEPMPQTLYRIPAEPGQPVMIQVPLTIVE